MLANLDRTKAIGVEVRALLERGDVEQFARAHARALGEQAAPLAGHGNGANRHLYTLARRSGVIGGKLVGAGGGGFLLVYARRPDDTRQAMAAAGAPELRFDFEFQGCYGVEYT